MLGSARFQPQNRAEFDIPRSSGKSNNDSSHPGDGVSNTNDDCAHGITDFGIRTHTEKYARKARKAHTGGKSCQSMTVFPAWETRRRLVM